MSVSPAISFHPQLCLTEAFATKLECKRISPSSEKRSNPTEQYYGMGRCRVMDPYYEVMMVVPCPGQPVHIQLPA